MNFPRFNHLLISESGPANEYSDKTLETNVTLAARSLVFGVWCVVFVLSLKLRLMTWGAFLTITEIGRYLSERKSFGPRELYALLRETWTAERDHPIQQTKAHH